MVKTPDEIALLKEISSISEETNDEVYSGLKPGTSEKEVESGFAQVLSEKGGELKKARFGPGDNTGMGNPLPVPMLQAARRL
jgi:Xaa-Pro aminopeptidase